MSKKRKEKGQQVEEKTGYRNSCFVFRNMKLQLEMKTVEVFSHFLVFVMHRTSFSRLEFHTSTHIFTFRHSVIRTWLLSIIWLDFHPSLVKHNSITQAGVI